jgi:hypothetical protein
VTAAVELALTLFRDSLPFGASVIMTVPFRSRSYRTFSPATLSRSDSPCGVTQQELEGGESDVARLHRLSPATLRSRRPLTEVEDVCVLGVHPLAEGVGTLEVLFGVLLRGAVCHVFGAPFGKPFVVAAVVPWIPRAAPRSAVVFVRDVP